MAELAREILSPREAFGQHRRNPRLSPQFVTINPLTGVRGSVFIARICNARILC
jgi:hypothetical protein